MMSKRFSAYSIYITLVGLFAFATIVSWILYALYDFSYLSIAFGGFLTGLTGVTAVTAQELQKRERIPRVYFHSWKNPKVFNSNNGEYTFPIILKNIGLEPGRRLLCLLRVTNTNGSTRVGGDGWGEATASNLTGNNEIVFQKKFGDEIVYPKPHETEVGRVIIKAGTDGNFCIEVNGIVYEESGVSVRNCKFVREAPDEIRVDCEPERNFRSYY